MAEEGVSSDVREIEAVLASFEKAVTDADCDLLRACLSEEVTFVFTGGAGPVRGRDSVAATWERHLAQWSDVRIVKREVYVRIHGDTAWATYLWDGEGTAETDVYRVSGERWTMVLVWEDGGWCVAHGHSSLPFTDWRALRVEEEHA